MNSEYAEATEASNPSQRICGLKRDSGLNSNTQKNNHLEILGLLKMLCTF